MRVAEKIELDAATERELRVLSKRRCVFRTIVTDRFGIVTAEFGNVTGDFGDVTDIVFAPA